MPNKCLAFIGLGTKEIGSKRKDMISKTLAVFWRTHNLTGHEQKRDRHINKSFYFTSFSVAIKTDIKL